MNFRILFCCFLILLLGQALQDSPSPDREKTCAAASGSWEIDADALCTDAEYDDFVANDSLEEPLLLVENETDDEQSTTDKSRQEAARVPIFLIPSLAGTRLRTWSNLNCGPSVTQFNIGGAVWLDVKRMLLQTKCWIQCLQLRPSDQTDFACVTRPDEGLDAVTQVDETVPLTTATYLLKPLIQLLASMGYEPEHVGAPLRLATTTGSNGGPGCFVFSFETKN